MDRNWVYVAQKLRGDMKLHEAILQSNRYDPNSQAHAANLLVHEQYLLAEAEFNAEKVQ